MPYHSAPAASQLRGTWIVTRDDARRQVDGRIRANRRGGAPLSAAANPSDRSPTGIWCSEYTSALDGFPDVHMALAAAAFGWLSAGSVWGAGAFPAHDGLRHESPIVGRFREPAAKKPILHFGGFFRRRAALRAGSPPDSIGPKFWPLLLRRRAPAVSRLVRFWAGTGQNVFT